MGGTSGVSWFDNQVSVACAAPHRYSGARSMLFSRGGEAAHGSLVHFISEQTMSVELPTESYGERTAELARVIKLAESIAFGGLQAPISGVPHAKSALVQHILGIKDAGFIVPKMNSLRLIRGSATGLLSEWGRGQSWRLVLSDVVARVYASHSNAADSTRLKGPIWYNGCANVFSVVLVATRQNWELCERIATSPREVQDLWRVVAFFEKLVDGSLVSALFADRKTDAILLPLLELLRLGVIPLGWYDGSFACFQLVSATYTAGSDDLSPIDEAS